MGVDTDWIRLAVQVTARISATAFVFFLLSAGIARWCQPVQRRRFFWTFLVAHTVHFGAVLMLAVATDGQNIQERQGWGANVLIGTLFYVGCIWVLRVLSGRTGRRGELVGEWAIAAIWLGFLQAYVLRALGSVGFAFLAIALAVGYAVHLTVRIRRGNPAA